MSLRSLTLVVLSLAACRARPDATSVGAARRVPSGTAPTWSPESWDPHGAASFWSVPAAGGRPRELARIDDPLRPSYRPGWALGSTRIYFTVEDRQRNVRVMETSGL